MGVFPLDRLTRFGSTIPHSARLFPVRAYQKASTPAMDTSPCLQGARCDPEHLPADHGKFECGQCATICAVGDLFSCNFRLSKTCHSAAAALSGTRRERTERYLPS